MTNFYSASAPGTIMLLGEHSVLENKHAMVAAIDKRIKITLKARKDFKIIIDSDIGKLECSLNEVEKLKSQKPFTFILETIFFFRNQLSYGFELSIIADFSNQLGLGSSASITVTAVALFQKFCYPKRIYNKIDIFHTARIIVRKVQNCGSGADIAASLYGGILGYIQNEPYIIEKFKSIIPIILIYSGSKTSTKDVVEYVKNARIYDKENFANYDQIMDNTTLKAFQYLKQNNLKELGNIMNIQHKILNNFGVATKLLNELVDILSSCESIYGAKISGSGLGDCVLGLGSCHNISLPKDSNVQLINTSISSHGLIYE
jgi:mevalonate kinase